jgi:hypothetical protein
MALKVERSTDEILRGFGGTMRTMTAFLLLLSSFSWAQSNTAENPVNVHVSSSHWVVLPTSIGPLNAQMLNVVIEGKKYELEAQVSGKTALIALGDYKAKLVEDVHKNSYESSQTYEFQFPDGKTRKFLVIGQSE